MHQAAHQFDVSVLGRDHQCSLAKLRLEVDVRRPADETLERADIFLVDGPGEGLVADLRRPSEDSDGRDGKHERNRSQAETGTPHARCLAAAARSSY